MASTGRRAERMIWSGADPFGSDCFSEGEPRLGDKGDAESLPYEIRNKFKTNIKI